MEADTQEEVRINGDAACRFSFSLYFRIIAGILSSPRQFFKEYCECRSIQPAMGCLMLSSIFYTFAALTQPHEQSLITGTILFINAVGMCLISTLLGFTVMTMTLGRRARFWRVFSVYAFSSSVTLLAAWIPLFVWITEPWKWILISLGLIRGCGLRWFQAILVVGISIFIWVILFWCTGPIILYLKG